MSMNFETLKSKLNRSATFGSSATLLDRSGKTISGKL